MSGEPFGQHLTRLRLARGLCQSALAARSGLNGAALWRYESGQGMPRRSSVLSLASALLLDQIETDLLLASAGFLPDAIARLSSGQRRQLLTWLADPASRGQAL